MSYTAEEKAALMAAFAIAEAIRSLHEVPSGHLYANVMHMMTLDTYERIISSLINAKLVKRQSHVLTWIGPALKES